MEVFSQENPKIINLQLVLQNMLAKNSEAATRIVLQKKVFLKILQNSQENTCVRVFFK